MLWSQGYCLLTVGGALLKVLNQYIETQGQNQWEVKTMLLNQKYEIFPTEAQKEVLDRWL